jgi:hypothetical protein
MTFSSFHTCPKFYKLLTESMYNVWEHFKCKYDNIHHVFVQISQSCTLLNVFFIQMWVYKNWYYIGYGYTGILFAYIIVSLATTLLNPWLRELGQSKEPVRQKMKVDWFLIVFIYIVSSCFKCLVILTYTNRFYTFIVNNKD